PMQSARPAAFSFSRVSSVFRPHSSAASLSSAFPLRISIRTGVSDLPMTRTTSNPAFRNVGPQKPPAAEHEEYPVRGETLTTHVRLQEAIVPSYGDLQKNTGI